jgi:hypothetical protein
MQMQHPSMIIPQQSFIPHPSMIIPQQSFIQHPSMQQLHSMSLQKDNINQTKIKELIQNYQKIVVDSKGKSEELYEKFKISVLHFINTLKNIDNALFNKIHNDKNKDRNSNINNIVDNYIIIIDEFMIKYIRYLIRFNLNMNQVFSILKQDYEKIHIESKQQGGYDITKYTNPNYDIHGEHNTDANNKEQYKFDPEQYSKGVSTLISGLSTFLKTTIVNLENEINRKTTYNTPISYLLKINIIVQDIFKYCREIRLRLKHIVQLSIQKKQITDQNLLAKLKNTSKQDHHNKINLKFSSRLQNINQQSYPLLHQPLNHQLSYLQFNQSPPHLQPYPHTYPL